MKISFQSFHPTGSIIDKLDSIRKWNIFVNGFTTFFRFAGQNFSLRFSNKTCGCFKSIFAGKRYSYLYEDFLT